MTPAETRAALVEAIAIALWRLDHPEDDQFSQVAPNDWSLWPQDGRAASLAYETHSKEDYREQADTAINTLSAKLAELGLKIVPVEATEEMREALSETVTNGTCVGSNDVVEWAPGVEDRAWSAMLAAAPDVLGGPNAD